MRLSFLRRSTIPLYRSHLKCDWLGFKISPATIHERQALLMSPSPSTLGGNRGLCSLRISLEHLGARVFPDMFSLATTYQAFKPEVNLRNETLAKRFEDNIVAFISLIEAAKINQLAFFSAKSMGAAFIMCLFFKVGLSFYFHPFLIPE